MFPNGRLRSRLLYLDASIPSVPDNTTPDVELVHDDNAPLRSYSVTLGTSQWVCLFGDGPKHPIESEHCCAVLQVLGNEGRTMKRRNWKLIVSLNHRNLVALSQTSSALFNAVIRHIAIWHPKKFRPYGCGDRYRTAKILEAKYG